jgi:hypothetical protein
VNLGQNTSHFAGSPYARMLTQLGAPSDVVETDYDSSTALFTGHETRGLELFTETLSTCNAGVVRSGLALDEAGFLLLGDVNKPGVLDSPCLMQAASSSPWAVPLLHTSRDNASVFELIGPGTGHPDLQDLTAAATRTRVVAGPSVTWEWDWSSSRPVSQVSVGQAGAVGSTSAVALQVRELGGDWLTLAGARSAIGDGARAAPYLLATLPAGTRATALRIVISTAGSQVPAAVATAAPVDVAALGPRSGP